MDAVIAGLPTYFRGFMGTLELLVYSGAGALVIGAVIAGLRISPVASLRWFATVYTEVVRNIPLLLVLFFCGVVLPYLKVDLDFFVLALIGLTVYTSPFVAESIRSGVNGVPVGQAEAARSIGLRFGQTLTLIVMPQAIRMTVPPLINVLIALVKNTSVAGAFYVYELFHAANDLTNLRGDKVVLILVGIAVLYLVITVPLGLIAGAVEKRVAVLR